MKNAVFAIACCLTYLLAEGVSKAVLPDRDLSFYQTNLVCGAASDIGCGTRAKPILADFMENEVVEEAWLNHAGTVIAVVWKEETGMSKSHVANEIFARHDQPFIELSGENREEQLMDFEKGKWYKGNEVDQLSIIEAGRIADQLLSWLDRETDVDARTRDEVRSAFTEYITREFLAIEDANVIYDANYWKRWEKELTAIGRVHLGDDMPDIEIVSKSSSARQECTNQKSCCTKKGSKDCCKKGT